MSFNPSDASIVLTPGTAAKLSAWFDVSDIGVAEYLRKEAFSTDEVAPTITYTELKNAYLKSYWGRYSGHAWALAQCRDAAIYVLGEVHSYVEKSRGAKSGDGKTAEMPAEGHGTAEILIEDEQSASMLFHLITGESTHLKAGGAIVDHTKELNRRVERDDQRHLIIVSDGKGRPVPYVKVRIYSPHYQPGNRCERFIAAHQAYLVDTRIDGVDLSYRFTDPSYLHGAFLMTHVMVLGALDYPGATMMSELRQLDDGSCVAQAHKVEDDFAKGVYVSDHAKRAYDAARQRRGKGMDAGYTFLTGEMIPSLDDVTLSSVFRQYHTRGPDRGMYTYINSSAPAAIGESIGIRAALATALFELEDPRVRGGFAIPTWSRKLDRNGQVVSEKRDVTFEPYVKD